MREAARHSASGVVLGEPIRGQYVGKALVGRIRVLVVGALHRICGGILRDVRIQQIVTGRLQRFVVGGQRAIFQSARDPDPAHAVRMHDEGLIARDGVVAIGIFARLVIGSFVFGEVGVVVAGPLVLLLVPPDEFLALAPRLAVGTRRRAVIKD